MAIQFIIFILIDILVFYNVVDIQTSHKISFAYKKKHPTPYPHKHKSSITRTTIYKSVN